jgi:hypothetical protein
MITIPSIGSILTLTQDWTFPLWAEKRNQTFWEALFGEPHQDPEFAETYDLIDRDAERGFQSFDQNSCWQKRYRFWHPYLNGRTSTLPPPRKSTTLVAGTQLKVSRIYIRQGQNDFNSITFTVAKSPQKWKGRFWAKLEDVNRIEADWDSTTIERN